ncbi:MAG: type II secretion system protein [Candidatus Omnitrophica bacterium]|nr:type II secretion system protein [Candidatus Omnitrophota bacterium]
MKPSKTFTLIELILVVAIVAVLAGAMVPFISSARQRARIAKVLLLYEATRSAAKLFYAEAGFGPYESSENTCHELYSNVKCFNPGSGGPITGWDGPYISNPLSRRDGPYNSGIHVATNVPPAVDTGIFLILRGVPRSDAEEINKILEKNDTGFWAVTGDVQHTLIIDELRIKLAPL